MLMMLEPSLSQTPSSPPPPTSYHPRPAAPPPVSHASIIYFRDLTFFTRDIQTNHWFKRLNMEWIASEWKLLGRALLTHTHTSSQLELYWGCLRWLGTCFRDNVREMPAEELDSLCERLMRGQCRKHFSTNFSLLKLYIYLCCKFTFVGFMLWQSWANFLVRLRHKSHSVRDTKDHVLV